MNDTDKNLLSMVYTYGGAPVEACDTERVESMNHLEQRGLVNYIQTPYGEFGPAYWVTPALKVLNWERETELVRIRV